VTTTDAFWPFDGSKPPNLATVRTINYSEESTIYLTPTSVMQQMLKAWTQISLIPLTLLLQTICNDLKKF